MNVRNIKIETEFNMSDKKEIQNDKYCWTCVKKSQPGRALVNCSNCPRSFHVMCMSKRGAKGNPFICRECVNLQQSLEQCNTSKQNLQRSLKFLYDRIDNEYKGLTECQLHTDITEIVTFQMINDKIEDSKYNSSREFMADILRIRHNALICDSSSEMKRLTSDFVEYVENEIQFIDACSSCYTLANQSPIVDGFVRVCDNLHSIVWAKVIGFAYEPAKLMRVQNMHTATVHFFGDHSIAHIHTKFCLEYSEKSPNQYNEVRADIMQEVKEYKKNLGSAVAIAVSERPKQEPASTISSPQNIRKSVIEIMDKYEEELNENYKKKELVYQTEIKELEVKLISQKREHEEFVQTLKRKKWCDCCYNEAQTENKIFCSNSCGADWYQKQITK